MAMLRRAARPHVRHAERVHGTLDAMSRRKSSSGWVVWGARGSAQQFHLCEELVDEFVHVGDVITGPCHPLRKLCRSHKPPVRILLNEKNPQEVLYLEVPPNVRGHFGARNDSKLAIIVEKRFKI
jgi:hypothetical protein